MRPGSRRRRSPSSTASAHPARPTNRISVADLVLYGGEEPSVLHDPLLERKSGLGARLYELADSRPGDLFVIISNSGVNISVIEMALRVKERDHRLVAITSLTHSHAVPALHPSGHRLADLADVVLDNGAPAGDATLELPGGAKVGAVSTLTSALLAQLMIIDAVKLMLAEGEDPPVYLSANVPGGYEHNLALDERYAGRLRRIAS